MPKRLLLEGVRLSLVDTKFEKRVRNSPANDGDLPKHVWAVYKGQPYEANLVASVKARGSKKYHGYPVKPGALADEVCEEWKSRGGNR